MLIIQTNHRVLVKYLVHQFEVVKVKFQTEVLIFVFLL